MSNVLHVDAREDFLKGDIDWLVDNYKVVLLRSTYTYSAAHDNLDDIASADRAATTANLSDKTADDGVADASDVTVAVTGGNPVTGLWLYRDSGIESTSRLVLFVDTDPNGSAINVTPNGGNVTVAWSNGANKIFRL